MADVSKIFKPRRGTASIMAGTKKSTVLASGELFVEVPNTGVGTGASKIKIGDGTTAYSALPYALGDTSNDQINFSSNTSTTVAAALNSVVTGASLKNIVAGLKQAISLCNTSITQLNDDTSKIKTYVGEDGQIHFTDVTGADSVLPFSKNNGVESINISSYNITSSNILHSNGTQLSSASSFVLSNIERKYSKLYIEKTTSSASGTNNINNRIGLNINNTSYNIGGEINIEFEGDLIITINAGNCGLIANNVSAYSVTLTNIIIS